MNKEMRINLAEKIAQGSFGSVYKGSYMEFENCAIKKIQIPHNSDTLLRYSDSEWKILQKLRQKNIISIYGVCKSKTSYYIAMEYCDGKDLETILEHCNYIPISLAREWLKDLIKALDYLKDMKVIHRDIKPSNILLTSKIIEKAQVKLVDFGLSTMIGDSLKFTKVGTPLYMAPEVLAENGYDYKADIWSLGLVVYKLLYGSYPYKVANLKELKDRQKFPIVYNKSENVSEEAIELMDFMIQYNPNDRLNYEDLLNLPFFKGKRVCFSKINEKNIEEKNSEEKIIEEKKINEKKGEEKKNEESKKSEKKDETSSLESLEKEDLKSSGEKNENLSQESFSNEDHVLENNIPVAESEVSIESINYKDYEVDIKEVISMIYELRNRAELIFTQLKEVETMLKDDFPDLFGYIAIAIDIQCFNIREDLNALKFQLPNEDVYLWQIKEVHDFIMHMHFRNEDWFETFMKSNKELTYEEKMQDLKQNILNFITKSRENITHEMNLTLKFIFEYARMFSKNHPEIAEILDDEILIRNII
jgi:serine/threonine protein kinase